MKQTWKKMSSLFLVVCMIFTMMPTSVFAVGIERPQVYFGKNSSGTPIKWYIVATDANSVTLWTTASMGAKEYDSSEHDNWSGSDICTWLNSTFLNDSFATAEQKAIAAYGNTEGPNSIDISQKIVLPSVEEMGTGSSTGTWGIDKAARILSNNWWLRTPSVYNNAAAYVQYDGEVLADGGNVSEPLDICPAFKLDASSILFATAATDGKSTSIGSLTSISAPSGAMKATIVDSDMATPSLTLAAETNGTNAIQFAYSDAQTGTNQYLSCALQQNKTLTYYGKLADCTSNASGDCMFSISGVNEGIYDLQIFCEQVNGDNISDFASAPVGTMTLTVDASGNGTISGTGFLTEDSTSPVLSAGSVNRTSDTEATIDFNTNEDGEGFYTVVNSGTTPEPTKEEIATGTSLGSVSGTATGKTVDLTTGAKDIFVVVKDASGNLSDPLKIEAAAYATTDTTSPILSLGSANRISDTVATIGFTTTEDGEGFYTVVNSGTTPEPTKEEVATGTSLGLVSGTVTSKAVDLIAGEKDIYVMVKDATGNLSDTLKIEAAAYVLPNTNVDTNGNINDGINFTSLLSGGGKVYYGSYRHILEPFHGSETLHSTWEQQDTPVLWRIMGEEPGSPENGVTLMSHYLVDCRRFGLSNDWEDSFMKALLNTTFSYSPDAVYLLKGFTAPEVDHILTTTGLSSTASSSGEIKQLSDCKFWLPDFNNPRQGFGGTGNVTWYANMQTSPNVQLGGSVNDNIATLKCGTVVGYWLRSPISNMSYLENQVDYYGYTDSAISVNGYNGIRPVCKLDSKSVLFASEILSDVTNKPWATAAVANNYAAGDGTAKNYKLTISNSFIQLGTLSLNGGSLLNGSTNAIELGTNLDITATGASADTKLTYKIVTTEGGERQVVGYGYGDNTSLTLETKDLSGADLSSGEYDVYVWAQKDNAINSNEGSTPLCFKMNLDVPYDVIVSNGTGSGSYVPVSTVTITANPAPVGQQFKEWSVDPDVIFVNGTSKNMQTAKFTMPAEMVTVTANYEPIPATFTGVTVNPSAVTVQKGKAYHFGAIVNGANNPSQTVTWTVEGGNGTTAIGNDGKLTIAANETATTLTVRATSVADTSKFGIATVTVTQLQPSYTHTVTFMNGTSIHSTKTVVSPATTVDTLPANPTNGSYTFSGWYTGTDGSGTSFNASTLVTSNTTVYAYWTGGGSGSGSGSSGGGGASSTTKHEADISGGNSSDKVEVKVDANQASADLTSTQVENGKDIEVNIPKISGVTNYSLGIPVSSFSNDSDNGSVILHTDVGDITLPSHMLSGTSTVSGNNAQIHIGAVKSSDLPKDAQDKVGNHPIVSLSLFIDGKGTAWNNPDAPVTVSIPYTPTSEELKNPDGITVFYIDGSGNLIEMKDAKYDTVTKRVVFTTTHFSYYTVGYKTSAPSVPSVNFSDVLPDAWYYDAVTFIAKEGITTGIGDDKFSPEATLTRGQFIVMLMKAYDIEEDKTPTDNFADAGNTYYTGYLAAAKRLGISIGVGDNKFEPEKAITRQEMFTLLYNLLKLLNKLPTTDTGNTLGDFADRDSVASWATEAMTVLVKFGTVSGSDGKLNPTDGSNRAQMAQVLYNLLGK